MVPPYILGTCPPTNPKTLWWPITPSSRKNWFSEGIFFWQITWTALESPKIDICQNWPRRVLGDVIRCLESKFDKKIPMGSVPNCQKEIPACHAIRWFKCKLKPPKNSSAWSHVAFLRWNKRLQNICCLFFLFQHLFNWLVYMLNEWSNETCQSFYWEILWLFPMEYNHGDFLHCHEWMFPNVF